MDMYSTSHELLFTTTEVQNNKIQNESNKKLKNISTHFWIWHNGYTSSVYVYLIFFIYNMKVKELADPAPLH